MHLRRLSRLSIRQAWGLAPGLLAALLMAATAQAQAPGGSAPPVARTQAAPPLAPASATVPEVPGAAPAGATDPQAAAPVSRDARRVYETSRAKLVQIRTLLRNTNTQTSVGSGFFVAGPGLIVTNFHVASQLALDPERHRGVYVPVDGKEGEVELLAFDVTHDLAVLRVKSAEAGASWPVLDFRPEPEPLSQGDRIYSLGNPLDIGFAVMEGTFNGLVQRSFYPRIFFGGALNPGMSGGPALDDQGRVIGVNVAKRLDGEQVSFLIPAGFAQALLARAAGAQPITRAAHAEVARQLLAHQGLVAGRFMASPLRTQRHGGYAVPVPDDALARCWGAGRTPDARSFSVERTDCQVDSHVFAGDFNTGFLRLRYEAYDAPNLGQLRFAMLHSASFRNEAFAVRGSRHKTPAECTERYIEQAGMPMRAVICFTGYRKLPGLYDVSVLVATLNQPTQGVQGRLDAQGVSFDNGLKMVQHYLAGFRWEGGKP
ncbi:MAG: trypsin-like peptidase domain-containing protein [Burkholderiales bacterium]|nr:trypsin-like peptidase domain-containing protein [Burkholderiales bacterium]